MHCPRCGTNASDDQQFCRSCGLGLEKIAELLGDELAVEPASSIDERARLRERQRKFEEWSRIAGLVTFGLILLFMIVGWVFSMILLGRAMVIPGLFLILLAIGAAVMGLFQTYSKSLKGKIEERPLARAAKLPEPARLHEIDVYREPVPTVTDRTTELLVAAKSVETGKMND